MKATRLSISDVILLEPKVFEDSRGYFFESFNQKIFEEIIGRSLDFVQDNKSRSKKHVLRGLHYQLEQAQAKLVRVDHGEIFDVAVDLRQSSSTYGQWVSAYLSAENKHQLWIPEGFAHGFLALSDDTEVSYKASNYWAVQHERCVLWSDPDLNIAWPIPVPPRIAAKDLLGAAFAVIEPYGRK